MRISCVSRWVAFAALFFVAAADAAAQGVPARVGSFVLTDSSRDQRAGEGVTYTYFSDAEGARAFAYRQRRAFPEAQQLAREAETFVASLEAGVERGWYSAVRVVVNETRTFETAAGPRPGHLVVAVLGGEDGALVSFLHVVVLGDELVRARLTLPAEKWRTSTAPDFAIDLFRALNAPVP